MFKLYDEQEVMRNYIDAEVREQVREACAAVEVAAEARGIVSACKDFGVSTSDTVTKLVENLSMTEAEAKALVESLW